MKQIALPKILTLTTAALAIALWGCGAPKDGETSTTGGSTTAAGDRPASTAEGNAATGDTIQLGLVASLNGELRPWGVDCVNGAQIAVDDFNAAGGLNGKKVKLKIEDSNSKPEQGKNATEKLISDGSIAVMGEVASGITLQMGEVAFKKGVPVVAIGSTRADVTKIGTNMFRVCYTDDFQGPVMATFAYSELGLRKVAIMTDRKQPYSTGLSDSFRKKFTELGGTIVDEQFYEGGQTQFGAQLTSLKAKSPDGLFLSGYFTEVGPIARQVKEAGMNVKLMGGDGWDSSELLNTGGDAIVGGFFCNHYNSDEDRPAVKSFLAKWKAKYAGKMPGTTMGALAYDAAMLTLDALKRAKGPNSKDLITAIDETEGFKGVTGTIDLKGHNGDPAKGALVVRVNNDKAHPQVPVKHYEYTDIAK